MRNNYSQLFSPEKSFELPSYAQGMARAYVEGGCIVRKHRRDTYALNVLQFIDGSASEGRESSESSSTSHSVAESTAD